jgi:hypothetical protein
MSTKSPKSNLLIMFVLLLACSVVGFAQSSTATLSGSVTDERGAMVAGATVRVSNSEMGFSRTVTTDENGSFTVPLLPPSTYLLTIERTGFAPFEVRDLVLNVNDRRALNVHLSVGQVSGTVNVTSEPSLIDESPAVQTTIDSTFVSNLPLNGRSIQTLIALSPGVVAVPVAGNGGSQGQFSVNGQRTNSNYFTVDGVSGNFSVTNFEGPGQNASGSIPATNIQGSFSSLASVDALQEFSIQTSTFAAEFGHSPGAQVSLVTRPGENKFHGSLFEYFRNDVFDARDFFDARKPPLRYNNFGGTFSGPVILPYVGEGTPMFWKGTDRTFFFFSYEGQRFVLPQPGVSITVPSVAARTTGINALGPPNANAAAILKGFPLPNGAELRDANGNLTGGAIYTASFSNPNVADFTSIRFDHNFSKNVTLFGRYNVSPSNVDSRSTSNPSNFQTLTQKTEMLTFGSTQVFGQKLVNETRVNFSREEGFANFGFDGYGGGTLPDPSIFLPQNTSGLQRRFTFNPITNVSSGGITFGDVVKNKSKQFYFSDNLSYRVGEHQLKFGGDYRRLTPTVGANDVIISNVGNTLQSVYNNVFPTFIAFRSLNYELLFKTFSIYGQDTWKASKRLTLTYGLRWEINPSVTSTGDKKPLTFAAPPNLAQLDQSFLQLAPIGTSYYETKYTNLAPRFGAAYSVSQKPGRELVVRGGIGVFYDLGQTGFGTIGFPYSLTRILPNISFPVSEAAVIFPPPNFTPSPTNRGSLTVADSEYTLPRTYQWNLTAEQSLGRNQSISVGYVAALGRDLVRVRSLNFATSSATPNTFFSPNFSGATFIDNGAESSYHSLQAQFTRRLSKGFQTILSYTWSHSIDNASNDSGFPSPGYVFPQDVYHGDSDFDVRHIFSGAVTYNIPTLKWNKFASAVLGGWSLNSVFSARTGLPYTITINESTPFSSPSFRRPNLTGAPLYLDDSRVATGRRLNPAAFNFALPSGQMGNLGRNALRGPAFWQVDASLQRTFGLLERLKMQLRWEVFNIFNHPNFLYPGNRAATFNNNVVTVAPNFGVITSSASRGFGGGGNTGGFNPLFQNGGPRSMQFAIRFMF